jgi:hypothetical protein
LKQEKTKVSKLAKLEREYNQIEVKRKIKHSHDELKQEKTKVKKQIKHNHDELKQEQT